MSRWAHVRAGRVVAVSEGPTPPDDAASTLVACDASVEDGDTYNGAAFAPGARFVPPVPMSVSMRQARDALALAGLDDAVDSAINAIRDPVRRKLARNAWERSSRVERRNGVLAELAPTLGLTEAQVDDLFRTAARL